MSTPVVEGVIDLTFLDLREEGDVSSQLTLKLHPPAAPSSPSGKSNATTLGETQSPTKSRKDEIKAIRLGNNSLRRMEALYSIPQQLDSSKLLWLDLSFNNFTSISPDLVSVFPNLTTVYLHANKISNLQETKHLANLGQLRSLSLFGNPVEEKKHYRNFILYHCPKLAQFDKSPVTRTQREKVEVWAQTFRKKLNPSEEED